MSVDCGQLKAISDVWLKTPLVTGGLDEGMTFLSRTCQLNISFAIVWPDVNYTILKRIANRWSLLIRISRMFAEAEAGPIRVVHSVAAAEELQKLL